MVDVGDLYDAHARRLLVFFSRHEWDDQHASSVRPERSGVSGLCLRPGERTLCYIMTHNG